MWLAIDVGTTNLKAALLDDTLAVQGVRQSPLPTDGDLRPEQWWDALVALMAELSADERASVTQLVITGRMQDVILLDENGASLRPIIPYFNTDASEQAARFVQGVDLARLRETTGNKQAEGADGFPAKLMRLAETEADTLAKIHHLLFGAVDYMVYRLADVFVSDSTTASTTGLMHMRKRCLIDRDLLPEAIQPVFERASLIFGGGETVGTLTPAASAALGLAETVEVAIGGGDAGTTTLGAGAGEIGTAYAYMGTSGWVAFTAEQPADFDSGVITIAHPHHQRVIQIAPLMTAAGNLDWALGVLEAERDSLLADASAEPLPLLYLPYLNGERSPFIDPHARGAFIGLSSSTTRTDMARAVMSGVAMAYRHALEALMGQLPPSLMVTGGGTQNALWMQIFADVLGLPIHTPDNPDAVGLRGAVLASQVRDSLRNDYALQLTTAATYTPNAAHHATYSQHYALFKQAYLGLKTVFSGLAETVD